MRPILRGLVVIAVGVGPLDAVAQPATLFHPVAATEAMVGGQSRALRERAVDPDLARLRAVDTTGTRAPLQSRLTLNLFDDVELAVVVDRQESTLPGQLALVGHVEGDALSAAYFVVDGGALSADISTANARYEVRPGSDGHHVVRSVDPSTRFTCGTTSAPRGAAVATPMAALRATEPIYEGVPVTVDLLAVYTPAALAGAGSVPAMHGQIALAVVETNDALARSLVPHRFRLAHSALTPYQESGSASTDQNRLIAAADGFMDEVPILRNSVQADLVVLVIEQRAYPQGIATLMYNQDYAESEIQTSVSDRELLTWVVPHELGHNLGSVHDHDTSPGTQPTFPYAFGYRIPGQFSTIMAYQDCSQPCPRIPYYSNPAVSYNGTATGVANYAEEARTFTQTMPIAASYRGCRTQFHPSTRTVHVGRNATSVSWQLVTDPGCIWVVEEPQGDWITRTTPERGRATGLDPIPITVSVGANTEPAARVGSFWVNTVYPLDPLRPLHVVQDGCARVASPLDILISEAGGPGVLVIDASPGCPWSIGQPSSRITFTSPQSGTGSAQVTFTIPPNAAISPLWNSFNVYVGANFVGQAAIVQDGSACGGALTLAPRSVELASGGGSATLAVTAPSGCGWTVQGLPPWLTAMPVGHAGTGTILLQAQPNTDASSRGGLLGVNGRSFSVRQAGNCASIPQVPSALSQAGGRFTLPVVLASSSCPWGPTTTTEWASVARTSNSLLLDVDRNEDLAGRTLTFVLSGRTYSITQRGRGSNQIQYLAEGATGSFFSTRLALLNPSSEAATADLRFLRGDGTVVTRLVPLPAHGRATVAPASVAGLESADFATVVESTVPIAVDRTMSWDRTGYGSHAETALSAPSQSWYLAEGSTAGDFSLFYLLQNPNAAPTDVTIKYLRPLGLPPIVQTRTLGANSRTTIPVDTQGPELASTDVSAVITASAPIIVERSMYINRPGQPFAAGHESAGVTAPATTWFLAEGATGPFFDLFILLANPGTQPAQVTVDYLLSNGTTHTKVYTVPAESRFTVWVDNEQIPAGSGLKPLDNVAVSSTISSTVPIIVERAMWWPSPALGPNFWTEAHNSPGVTAAGTRWALAEGEVGGGESAETYILIANTSAIAGSARVTLYFDDGTSAVKTFALLPRSRTNVSVSGEFPAATGRRFGSVIESLGGTPAQIVVERAMYSSPGGVTWAAGTNAVATRLQ